MNILTQAQLDELIRFAKDDRAIASMEAIEALNALHTAVQRNTTKYFTGVKKRNAMLEERMSKMREIQRERYEGGEFGETGLDSVDVANGLLYQLQKLKTYKLDAYKVQAILYEMYASWLESKKQRLFIEHPVATKYGPRFWKVYSKVKTDVPVGYQTWQRLAEQNPGVAKFCENAAQKYYDETEGNMTRIYLNSKPYKNADLEHNNGKWNKEISDGDIYVWKSKQKLGKG